MDPIAVDALVLTGRVNVRDPNLGNTFATNNADFSGIASYAYQFGVQSQGQTFGTVKSMFLDNGSNPSEVEVAVSGTDQFFTIPAYSIGTYTIDANAGSTVTLSTDGGATDICTVIFYNWERAPVVWYSFGAFNSDRPIKVYGTMAEGDDIATAEFNDPAYVGGIKPDGTFKGINVDANGNIIVSNLDITIGAVYGPDATGNVPTHPGILNAVLDSSGDVANVSLNASSEFRVHDEDVLVAVQSLDVNSTPSNTATRTSVVASVADTSLLVANANRRNATIYNDSTAILYVALGAAAASTIDYTTQVGAGGYYELPTRYTGAIRAVWSAANGSARITEMT
jgi:hypothetical protein